MGKVISRQSLNTIPESFLVRFRAVSGSYHWQLTSMILDKLRKLNDDRRVVSIHYFDVSGDEAIFMDCTCRQNAIEPCLRHSRNIRNAKLAAPFQMPPVIAYTFHLGTQYLGSLQTPLDSARPPVATIGTPKSSFPSQSFKSSASINIGTLNLTRTVTPCDSGYGGSRSSSSVSSHYSSYQGSESSLQSNMAATSLSGNPRTMYAVGNNGTPVNTTYGLVTTAVTGIHIKGLSYSTSQPRLISWLTAMGCQSQSCKLNMDRDGRSKGSALAKYGSQSAAQTAVEVLDGSSLDGRTITVKLDVNRSAISGGTGSRSTRSRPSETRPPMVLDGSAGRRDPSS